MERVVSVGETIECGGEGSEGTGAPAGLSGCADEESLWLLGMMLVERAGSSGASPFYLTFARPCRYCTRVAPSFVVKSITSRMDCVP